MTRRPLQTPHPNAREDGAGTLGVAWFSREQWARLKETAADADGLHDTHEEWVEAADRVLASMRAKGFFVLKIHVDVTELTRWCAEHGERLDGQGRSRFAAQKVREMTGKRLPPQTIVPVEDK